MDLTFFLFVAPSVAYAAVLLGGLWSLARRSAQKVEPGPVTVIVPARNEAGLIGACLEKLATQDFPLDRMQVVVVDDRSHDGTAGVARSWQPAFSDLHVVELRGATRSDLAPKKEALLEGLKRAKYATVALLDGDTLPSPTWLRSVTSRLTGTISACVGPVLFWGDGFWNRLAELEFLGLQAGGWIALAWGQPLNASAANLAFRLRGKHGGLSLRGSVASGDDVFLIQDVARSGRVEPVVQKKALVWTRPPRSIGEFAQQRLRWASKLLAYSRSGVAGLGVVYLYHVILLSGAVAALLGRVSGLAIVFTAGLKVAADLAVVTWATARLGILRRLAFFPLAELLLGTEVILAPLALLLPFEWKGRRYGPGGKVILEG